MRGVGAHLRLWAACLWCPACLVLVGAVGTLESSATELMITSVGEVRRVRKAEDSLRLASVSDRSTATGEKRKRLVRRASRSSDIPPRDVVYTLGDGQVLVGDICGSHQKRANGSTLVLDSTDLVAGSKFGVVSNVGEALPITQAFMQNLKGGKGRESRRAYDEACDFMWSRTPDGGMLRKVGDKRSNGFDDIAAGAVICMIHGMDGEPEIKSWFSEGDEKMQKPYFLLTTTEDNIPAKPSNCTGEWFCLQPWSWLEVEGWDRPHSTLVIWYSVGLAIEHPKLVPLPIGNDENMPDFDLAALRQKPKRKLLHAVYCWERDQPAAAVTVDEGGRSPDRVAGFEAVLHLVGISDGLNGLDRLDRAARLALTANENEDIGDEHARNPDPSYLEEMASYKFALAPGGSILDTYRTWQTLQVGVYPIVRRSHLFPALEELWRNLPIVIVDDYSQLSLQLLQEQYDRFHNQNLNFVPEKAFPSYWVHAIKTVSEKYSASSG